MKDLVKTIENFKKIALIFFIATGMLHIGTSILIANDLFLKNATIINKTMDIPFALTGIIYAFASFRLSLTDTDSPHKILDIVIVSIIALILIALISINLFIPNLNS